MNKPKTKHTPGPWEVFDSHSGIYILDSAEQSAVCRLEWCLEAEANARLIAAAPELLAALKRLWLYFGVRCDGTPRDWTEWREARAAIDKAEGRAEK